MWSFYSVAKKLPSKSWQQVMTDRHQMVHKKECLKHISRPSSTKSEVQEHFTAFFLSLVPGFAFFLGFGFRVETTLSGPDTILYLHLVLLMNFRITLLQWDKAKKTLTQDEEDGHFDSPTEHALNILGFPFEFECSDSSSWLIP